MLSPSNQIKSSSVEVVEDADCSMVQAAKMSSKSGELNRNPENTVTKPRNSCKTWALQPPSYFEELSVRSWESFFAEFHGLNRQQELEVSEQASKQSKQTTVDRGRSNVSKDHCFEKIVKDEENCFDELGNLQKWTEYSL